MLSQAAWQMLLGDWSRSLLVWPDELAAALAGELTSSGGFRRIRDSLRGPRVDFRQKAESIRLFSLGTPQMRAFHMTWIAFFLCFFAWFGIAPLMPIVRKELALTAT